MSLHVKNLSYSLGTKELLKSIDFDANEGNVLGIIGPNGAGKSTLLKHISAILPISQNQICLENEDFSKLKPRELAKFVAYLAQFSASPRMSVLETLELGRRAYSGMILSKEDKTKLAQMIEQFHLETLLSQDIGTLSGGERQKVHIASSLLQEPKILLLDEPISHLDPKNQQEMLSAIHEATYKKGLITLVVLHDLQHAIHYCDNLLMLKNGEIKYHIPTSHLQEEMLKELFDVDAKLYYASGHVFIYYGHQHHC